MSGNEQAIAEYRRQIAQCAQALALAQHESVQRFVVGPAAAEQIKLFTDGNLDKRYMKLIDHFDEMAAEFDAFDELVNRAGRILLGI